MTPKYTHNKEVAKKSLDKFRGAIKSRGRETNTTADEIIKQWCSFIGSEDFNKLIDCMDDPAQILGFCKEINNNLNIKQLIDVVAQHFAEANLVFHAIREHNLSKDRHLRKLPETQSESCDFFLEKDSECIYIECKYIKNLGQNKLEEKASKALSQIESSIKSAKEDVEKARGCVWIFSYSDSKHANNFQEIVEKAKGNNEKTFQYTLNVQVYGRALYGDARI